MVDAGGGRIGLRAVNNNRFVSNHLNWFNRLVASWATGIGDWERFEWVSAGGGRIALKSVVNGKYVTSDQNEAGILKAENADTIQVWEQFEWADLGPAP